MTKPKENKARVYITLDPAARKLGDKMAASERPRVSLSAFLERLIWAESDRRKPTKD